MNEHACTPEACPCNQRGLASCVSHRCRKHYAVPPLNATEHDGAECGACVQMEADHDWALWCEKWKAAVDTMGNIAAERATAIREAQALREQLAKLRKNVWHYRCPEHEIDASNAWGCPGCVAALRDENKALRARCERLTEALRDIVEDSHGDGPINRGLNSIQAAEGLLSEPEVRS